MVLDENQKDEIRTFALDREALRHNNLQDITSLKVRPVIVKDLTIFGTPGSKQKSRSRSKRAKSRGFDENLNIANTAYDLHLARSPKSVRSQKSLKSLKSVKSVLSVKSMKSNRKKPKERRKSKKRRASSDSEDIYERLHDPKKAPRISKKASSKSQRRKDL